MANPREYEYHLDEKLGSDGKLHYICTCGSWAAFCNHWGKDSATRYLLNEHWTDL